MKPIATTLTALALVAAAGPALAAGEGPAVLYCSMKKRSWLQPDGETTGNPYYGREMPSCGEVISR
jgi:hypothetical protein